MSGATFPPFILDQIAQAIARLDRMTETYSPLDPEQARLLARQRETLQAIARAHVKEGGAP